MQWIDDSTEYILYLFSAPPFIPPAHFPPVWV